jgi:hypothetical protein
MRKLISLFKSKKENPPMEVREKNLEDLERKYRGMLFEWIKGDLSGSTNTFREVKKIGDNFFIEFEEGGRINEDLVDEYTLFYPSPVAGLAIAPSTPPVEKSSSVTSIVYNESSPSSDPDSPIYTLLRKQKKNMVGISIKIELNLPSKELYGVLSSSFEDAESEIIKFVLDGVDIEDIKKSLSESIRKNYYSSKPSVEKEKEKKINSKEKEEQS